MKQLFLLLLFAFSLQTGFSQLNMTYIGQYNYTTNLNDIWGYTAPDSTEYALVGVRNGFSILSLADPANPVEVAFIPGGDTTWRDIKTWGSTAYVVCDSCSDGLLVVDLSDLPNSAPYFNLIDIPGMNEDLGASHNIYIDEFGYAYLAGCQDQGENSINSGGMLYFDCTATLGTATFVDYGPAVYSHDVYVRENKMYSSEIYEGEFTVYDVSDKSNSIELGAQGTNFEFTHNTWLSDDSNYLFTTDEVANAPVGSYDVSDPNNIIELDLFKPVFTLGDGVIPHNVHVWNDFIIISYYTDGCIVVDASRPENLIEVGNFDTYIPTSTGFNGVWGAYPFLPSGLVLLSDIGNGCYILEPDYIRACWLEGDITDAGNGNPIPGAMVVIDSEQPNIGEADFTGLYKTGQVLNGTFDVTYSAPGYISQIVSVVLENGVLTIQDVQLVSEVPNTLAGQVVDTEGNPLDDIEVLITSENFDLMAISNPDGSFSLDTIFGGTYQVTAGGWGYSSSTMSINVDDNILNLIVELEIGYQDEFVYDYNWTVNSSASAGIWERGTPQGTSFGNQDSNPYNDNQADIGTQCYVTGNGGGQAGNDDVDGGVTILTSPVMDLSDYQVARLNYDKWFFNDGGLGTTPNDYLKISVTNGLNTVELENITNSSSSWSSSTHILNDFIDLNSTVQIIFEAADSDPGHLVEAAIDVFEVEKIEQAIAPEIVSNIMQGCLPLEISFQGNSSDAVTFAWTFEGGTPSSSTEQNPVITYNNIGTFSVNLEIESATGFANASEEDFIIVNGPPSAGFNTSLIGNTVNFTNNSVGASTVSWQFGDANNTTSNEDNPSFLYPLPGQYEVVLFANNECGGSAVSQTINITTTSNFDLETTTSLIALPNPFNDVLNVDYDISSVDVDQAQIKLYNLVGQLIETTTLSQTKGNIAFGGQLSQGVYFIQLEIDGKVNRSMKVVKQ